MENSGFKLDMLCKYSQLAMMGTVCYHHLCDMSRPFQIMQDTMSALMIFHITAVLLYSIRNKNNNKKHTIHDHVNFKLCHAAFIVTFGISTYFLATHQRWQSLLVTAFCLDFSWKSRIRPSAALARCAPVHMTTTTDCGIYKVIPAAQRTS